MHDIWVITPKHDAILTVGVRLVENNGLNMIILDRVELEPYVLATGELKTGTYVPASDRFKQLHDIIADKVSFMGASTQPLRVDLRGDNYVSFMERDE